MGDIAAPRRETERPAPVRLESAAEAYATPLLERDELVAYAGWHGELRAA